jgi:Fe-S-cluster formation regulator IscX/YfhJ
MPDYNLYGLSARSFEQLVQAIAASVIGPGTVVFGDGPDGGREAVFEGKTQYPSSTSPWDGYVVVQAKFRQRLQSVEKDGTWVLAQLSRELKKFSAKKRELRRPEYYVFCTNVVLTPPDKAGTKDRAHRLLGEYAKKHSMKGFAIWDYDQIRTYLDDLPGIRQAYAAWITTGDVLAVVLRTIQWSRPDFEGVMTNFLQKELLADQYVNLEQAGHAPEERTPMARVFIDLPALPQPTGEPPQEGTGRKHRLPPGFVQEFLSAGAQRLTDVTSSTARHDSQEGKALLGRFVLVGGPGQGKTTISQFACQLHRASILSTRPSTILSREVRTALDEIAAHCANGSTTIPTCRRFPIRIILNQFARDLSSQKEGIRSILSYIARRIKNRTDQDVTVNDLRQWLKIYPWLLILDGLDEVPQSSNRDEVLAAVQDFWVDAAECQADILVLATTRPQGYEQDFSPQFYIHRYLAPLSRARAMQYGSWLAAARYGNDKDREQRIVARLRRASAEDATARLMRSPLQVTIMATLVDQTGQPPRERWRLFHEYYEVIYKREMERDIPAANILREHKSNIDGIHSQVGLILQTESETVGQTDARLTSAAFGAVVAARLKAEGYEGKALRGLERQIIEAATHRLVFLVGMEADQVGFEIRSLQEFMAAEALTDGTDTIVSDRLNSTAPIANWRNVFLFAAGKCFAVRQHLRDSVLTICITLNEQTEDEVSRRTFLGSQLALDLLVDGAAHQQPKFERSLARIAFRLADRPNRWLPNNLADAYQPSTEEVFREELSSRLSALTAEKAGVWAILLNLVERGLAGVYKISASFGASPSCGMLCR